MNYTSEGNRQMEKQIEVTTLKIQIGKRELELTVSDAKKLHAALTELFGNTVKHEHHYDGWRWPYLQPVFTYSASSGETFQLGAVSNPDSVTIINCTPLSAP